MNRNELYHFGILGMRWGVRRYQNKNGSLTAAGQKRYGQKQEKNPRDKYKDIQKQISKEAADTYAKYDTTKMTQASEEYNKLGDELAEDFHNYFESLKTNKKFQDSVYESMYKDFGEGSDDEEYFEFVADEYFFDKMRENIPDEIGMKLIKFEDAKTRYFLEAEKATKSLVEKYKDTQVDEVNSYWNAKRYIENEFLSHYPDANWNGYMARHFDDYWINDPAYEAMPDIINQKGYNEYVKTR